MICFVCCIIVMMIGIVIIIVMRKNDLYLQYTLEFTLTLHDILSKIISILEWTSRLHRRMDLHNDHRFGWEVTLTFDHV